MSRTIRLSLALLFALMMVIATASGALAFDPPDNAADGSAAAAMTGVDGFPAVVQGNPPANAGPWHATACGPNKSPASEDQGGPLPNGPINFADGIPPADCPPPPA